MISSPSHGGIIGALLRKDLRLYGRNKLYLFLTVLSLVMFVAIFWVIPDTVNETITLGLAPPLETVFAQGQEFLGELGVSPDVFSNMNEGALLEDEGLRLIQLGNPEELRGVIAGTMEVYERKDGSLILRDVEAGEKKPVDAERVHLDVGIAFPETFIPDVLRGEMTTVTVIADATVPPELRHAMASFVREVAYFLAGAQLPVQLPAAETIILGQDRVGEQVSLRDRLRPLLALMILVVETYAMASLISIEVLQRTVTALIVTPMQVWHFLTAKTLFGTGLAFGQGILVLFLVGAFTPANWSLLLVTMLVGALLFTGVAMLVGAAGKDFMDQLMYAMLFTVPMMIPAFSVLFPGTAATWVQAIPSYPVINLIVGATIYGAGWAESLGSLAYAALWVIVLYGSGLLVLKRKVETL